MPTSTQLTGAAYPMEVHGVKYSARTLTDKDHAELDGYVQAELMKVARETLDPGMTQEERKEQLSAALLTVGGLSWSAAEGQKIMSTLRGMIRLGWQMIKHYHNDLPFEKFYETVVRYEGEARDRGDVQKAIDSIDETFLVLNTNFQQSGKVPVSEDEGDSDGESKSSGDV